MRPDTALAAFAALTVALSTPAWADETIAIALELQEVAIQQLTVVAAKAKGADRQEDLLHQLTESLGEGATLAFKLAQDANDHERETILSKSRAFSARQIDACKRFVSLFPKSPDVPSVLLAKAKAERTLDRASEAMADFLTILDFHASSQFAGRAGLGVWELLVDAKRYQESIVQLRKVVTAPADPLHDLLQERRAWSHYYLRDFMQANQISKTLVSSILAKRAKKLKPSVELDSVMDLVSQIWAFALASKTPGFTLPLALSEYATMLGGRDYSSAFLRLATYIAARGLDSELLELAAATRTKPLERGHQLQVRLLVVKALLSGFRHAELSRELELANLEIRATSADPAFRAKPSPIDRAALSKAKLVYEQAARQLQAGINGAAKSQTPQPERSRSLVLAFEGLLTLPNLPKKDAAVYEYNLAQVQYHLLEYDLAATHFRRAADLLDTVIVEGVKAEDLRIKAIASRYKKLMVGNTIPEKIEFASTLGNPAQKDTDASFIEWTGWIDALATPGSHSDLDFYWLESARAQYSRGWRALAVKRLETLVLRKSASPQALPAATFAFQAYATSLKWESAIELGRKVVALEAARSSPLAQLAASRLTDAIYKKAEKFFNSRDMLAVLALARETLTETPATGRRNELRLLAARAALTMGQVPAAREFLAARDRGSSISPALASEVILVEAEAAEAEYDFPAARKLYMEWARLPARKPSAGDQAVAGRALRAAWLTGDPHLLEEVAGEKKICAIQGAACALNRDLATLGKSIAGTPSKGRTPESRGPLRTLLAFIDAQPKTLARSVKELADQWAQLDPVIALSALSWLAKFVPERLQAARRELRRTNPVKLAKASIDRRMRAIAEMESMLEQVNRLPGARFRAIATHEASLVYEELANDFLAIPAPSGLTSDDVSNFKQRIRDFALPLSGKSKTLAESAERIVAENAVEAVVLGQSPSHGPELDSLIVGPGRFPATSQGTPERRLADAVKARNFPLAALLIDNARSSSKWSPPLTAYLSASLLVIAGARAEGLRELEKIDLDTLELAARARASELLLNSYLESRSREKLRRTVEKTSGMLVRADLLEAARSWLAKKEPEI